MYVLTPVNIRPLDDHISKVLQAHDITWHGYTRSNGGGKPTLRSLPLDVQLVYALSNKDLHAYWLAGLWKLVCTNH